MSAVLEPKAGSPAGAVDVAVKLAFSKKIQAVTNRIHSTNNVDEIILEVSRDICQLFEADRMTIYTTSEDGASIVSKVKTGLNSFKDIKLPISESSLAGFCALHKRIQMRPFFTASSNCAPFKVCADPRRVMSTLFWSGPTV